MPIFEYRGLNKHGSSVRGTVDTDNIRTAKTRLKKDGIFVTDIQRMVDFYTRFLGFVVSDRGPRPEGEPGLNRRCFLAKDASCRRAV